MNTPKTNSKKTKNLFNSSSNSNTYSSLNKVLFNKITLKV